MRINFRKSVLNFHGFHVAHVTEMAANKTMLQGISQSTIEAIQNESKASVRRRATFETSLAFPDPNPLSRV